MLAVFSAVPIGLSGLVNVLILLIILVCICLALYWIAERFAPDQLIRKIVMLVIFVVALIGVLQILGMVNVG